MKKNLLQERLCNMNKKIIALLVLLALTALLAVGVFAAEEPKTVYLGLGKDANTMAEALKLLDGKGGTIVLCQEFSSALISPSSASSVSFTAA